MSRSKVIKYLGSGRNRGEVEYVGKDGNTLTVNTVKTQGQNNVDDKLIKVNKKT